MRLHQALGQHARRVARLARVRVLAVRILGHEYRIRSDADEAQIERVARSVDEAMARIREKTGTVDTLDLAILTALNLANDLLARSEGGERSDLSRLGGARVRALAELAEAAASEAPEAH